MGVEIPAGGMTFAVECSVGSRIPVLVEFLSVVYDKELCSRFCSRWVELM